MRRKYTATQDFDSNKLKPASKKSVSTLSLQQ